MVVIHHLIIALVLLLASPYLVVRLAMDARFRREWGERIHNWKRLEPQKQSLWVHASSVGEVRVAEILIQSLKQKYPDRPIVLSTFTTTGYQLASELELCPVFRLPPDVAPFIGPLVDHFDPSILILIEAEFWPVLLHICKARKVPAVLVNGRMSRKSFRNYRLLRPLFHWFVEGVEGFSMRSPLDAERVRRLGIAPNHVHILMRPIAPMPEIMQGIKGFTARQANRLLNRKGSFWQDESFDHWVRSEAEFHRIQTYIEQNPVLAGLASKPEDWPWSSAAANNPAQAG